MTDRQHYRLFWMKELDKLLRDPARTDAGRFEEYVNGYLRWELMHMLPAITDVPNEKGEIAVLTYYSTLFEQGPRDFMRIPVSTLNLEQENSPSPDAEADLLSQVKTAKGMAMNCL